MTMNGTQFKLLLVEDDPVVARFLLALVSDPRSFRLARAFATIKNNACRVSLVNLVEKIAASVPHSKRRGRS